MDKKILLIIVEDDNMFRDLMTMKLNLENFQVVEAADGEEGIKKIKEEKPDLVLLDVMLPGVDGFGVLDAIRKDPSLSKIKVFFLSNFDTKEDIEKGMKLGATDYLIKSQNTPADIIEKVKEALK